MDVIVFYSKYWSVRGFKGCVVVKFLKLCVLVYDVVFGLLIYCLSVVMVIGYDLYVVGVVLVLVNFER